MANKTFLSKLSPCIAQVNPSLDTSVLFDASYLERTDSPIDEFIARLKEINKLSPLPEDFNPLQGQLLLLGVIAAVESYLRTILRRLITLDPISQECVHRRDVSYSAAIHLSKRMMPEAMLEKISFISEANIIDAFRDLIGIKGNIPSTLKSSVSDYVRICQLRHCAVHRFGKLGVSNAINLGFDSHRGLLEKPLMLTYESLQDAIAIAVGLVKSVNNHLFNEVISRIASDRWTGAYEHDKKLFAPYYKIFVDTLGGTKGTGEMKDRKSVV